MDDHRCPRCGRFRAATAPACIDCMAELPRTLRLRFELDWREAQVAWDRPRPPPGRPWVATQARA